MHGSAWFQPATVNAKLLQNEELLLGKPQGQQQQLHQQHDMWPCVVM
jgi:hypothetical protein